MIVKMTGHLLLQSSGGVKSQEKTFSALKKALSCTILYNRPKIFYSKEK